MSRRLIIEQPIKIEKGWGYELHIHNADGYCSKILHFDKGAAFSLHMHIEKHETWYVARGSFELRGVDPDTTEAYSLELKQGDVVSINRGILHQLVAHEDSDIFEASTPDKPEDSYRIKKGDSQS